MTREAEPPGSLGNLLSEHKARSPAPIGIFVASILPTIFGAFALTLDPSYVPVSVVCFVFAFLLLIVAGWIYSRCIEIHEQGILYKSLFEKKSWRWTEFDALSFEIRQTHYQVNFVPVGGYLSQRYALSRNNKKLVELSDMYHNGLQGGEILMQITKQMFLPRYLRQLQQGETVSFGKRIKISKTGIIQGRKEIPWNTIKQIEMRDGSLRIHQIPRGYKIIYIQKIPNGHVLAELIAMAVQPRPRQHTYQPPGG
jgi:hypothetical protein